VEPELKVMPPKQYRRDCMRNSGHDDTVIPTSEVDARRLTGIVYREYLDPGYLIPKPDKLVPADVNEPVFSRRVPSALIYAQPGDRLKVHVLNGDSMVHSLHVHGLRYGIDSDGSWPLGTQSADGRRSDEICPNQSWTYTFDVDDAMVGAWPFHDHSRYLGESINRGLFGAIVVRPPEHHRDRHPDIELPEHIRRLLDERPSMNPREAAALFQSVVEWAQMEHTGSKLKLHGGLLTRLTEEKEPPRAEVVHDDGADLTSTTPTCYESLVDMVAVEGAITLSLRLTFGSPSDHVDIGAIGVVVGA